MQPLSVANKLLPGILLLLLAAFAPPLPCAAVTIEEIYSDDDGEGFKDETDLTQTQKDLISPSGNDAETLGEARTKAFEHAASILERALAQSNTIRISAKFVIFSGQEDSSDPPGCRSNLGSTTIATAGPRGYGYRGSRLDEGDTNRTGLGTAYPYALAEALLGKELNGQGADISTSFSKCVRFYYGFTGSVPANHINFVNITLHEIIHGLGFSEHVGENGDFPVGMITVTGTRNGMPFTRQATIESRTIYDEQMYSEADGDLLIDLSASRRAAAIISEDGLLWEGTDGGRNPCSYGQRMAELKIDLAKADGKPKLHAPSTYDLGESITHVHEDAADLMEPFYPSPRNMDLTLGILKDMGWGVSADGFPSDCEPSGITVTPEAGLVTTEPGGEARFEVRLDSKPAEDVTVSITSNDESEGVPDPNPLELTFTPSTWNTPQEVAIVGVDDGSQDGPQDYSVELKTDSDDRFYAVIRPKLVSLRNEDDDLLPELSIYNADAEEGKGILNFIVELSDTTAGTVTAQYAITGGTAQEGTDYAATLPNATVTLAPGEKETTISVTLIDDDEREANETLTITLSNPQNAVLAQNGDTATGTIRDNDQPSPPPPPPPDTQAGSNQQPPSTDTTPSVERQPADNPQPPDIRPPSSAEEGGGGGCAIASGKKVDNAKSAPLNLLAIVSAVFPVFFRKNRLIAQ